MPASGDLGGVAEGAGVDLHVLKDMGPAVHRGRRLRPLDDALHDLPVQPSAAHGVAARPGEALRGEQGRLLEEACRDPQRALPEAKQGAGEEGRPRLGLLRALARLLQVGPDLAVLVPADGGVPVAQQGRLQPNGLAQGHLSHLLLLLGETLRLHPQPQGCGRETQLVLQQLPGEVKVQPEEDPAVPGAVQAAPRSAAHAGPPACL
mmetsp:Transcript_137758/g.343845  ORF Transcript_137758/g.343845 Transcript_137758/m.343845 type:complete len:206 (+) Transcript_137758:153-770(+)